MSTVDEPLDDAFGHKTQHAKRQAQKNNKGAKFSSFRFPCQLANDEKQLIRFQEMVDAGMVPRGDLLDMKATVATDKQRVVVAENALFLSRLSLAQLLTLEDFENFDTVDTDVDFKISPVLAQTPEAIVQKANESRVEIKIAQAIIFTNFYSVRSSRHDYPLWGRSFLLYVKTQFTLK